MDQNADREEEGGTVSDPQGGVRLGMRGCSVCSARASWRTEPLYLLATHDLPLTTHYLPLTTHYSLLATHYSLLTSLSAAPLLSAFADAALAAAVASAAAASAALRASDTMRICSPAPPA